MASPGGYSVTPGLYRVPDLLTEEQFVKYMKEVYVVDVAFTHPGEKPEAVVNRALGGADSTTTPPTDPILEVFNNRDWNVPGVTPVQEELDLSLEESNKKSSSRGSK